MDSRNAKRSSKGKGRAIVRPQTQPNPNVYRPEMPIHPQPQPYHIYYNAPPFNPYQPRYDNAPPKRRDRDDMPLPVYNYDDEDFDPLEFVPETQTPMEDVEEEEDKDIGDQQPMIGFWKRVTKHFTSLVSGSRRTHDQLCSKWKNMNAALMLFNGFHAQATRLHQSGCNDLQIFVLQIFERALVNYHQQTKKHFIHVKAWYIVKDFEKWVVQPLVGEESAGSNKKRKSSESSARIPSNQMSREIERRILRHLHCRHNRIHLTQIHAHILRHRLHQSNQILSHFISVCSSLHKMNYAHLIFLQTQHPNILLYNSIIKGYSLSPPFQFSLHLFSTMKKQHRIWPDEFTFVPVLKSCSNLYDLTFGGNVHAQIVSLGFRCFSGVGVGLVELYVNCGKMKDAEKVFDEMPQRDVIVWNLMIRGWCKSGYVDMGYDLFRVMKERSVVTWNTMLSCLSKSGRDGEALKLFYKMRDSRFEVDEATVVTMLPVCARLGEDDIGKWIYSYAKSTGLYENHVSVRNSLVDFFCKRGLLDAAFMVFNDTRLKNVVSWNAMISGLAFNGKAEKGLALFHQMIKNGFNPNESTFVGALSCCVHSGLIQKGKEIFSLMTSNHQIEPKMEHYGCMVDLLGRGGLVKEAYGLLKSMPLKPNAALWGALLSSCRNHGDVEVAQVAVKELIILEPWNSGNYVLLSNIYAEEGKWDEVEKVRLLMLESKINKTAGQSEIR